MQEDMQDIFEVLRVVKRNGGRVGTDKTVLDENRNITFYQDYENAHGLRQTVGVKIPIDAGRWRNFNKPGRRYVAGAGAKTFSIHTISRRM